MYTVNIGEPDVRFGNMLLEQFGGANGELAAAMQYTIQGWNCIDDLGRRDLLMDIGTRTLRPTPGIVDEYFNETGMVQKVIAICTAHGTHLAS